MEKKAADSRGAKRPAINENEQNENQQKAAEESAKKKKENIDYDLLAEAVLKKGKEAEQRNRVRAIDYNLLAQAMSNAMMSMFKQLSDISLQMKTKRHISERRTNQMHRHFI